MFPKRFTRDDLRNLFAPFGEILSAVVIKSVLMLQKIRASASCATRRLRMLRLLKKSSRTSNRRPDLYVARALPIEEHRKRLEKAIQSVQGLQLICQEFAR
jgi:hypothetical protein